MTPVTLSEACFWIMVPDTLYFSVTLSDATSNGSPLSICQALTPNQDNKVD